MAVPLMETFEASFPPAEWLSFQNSQGGAIWTRSARSETGWFFSAQSRAENLLPGQVSRSWLVSPPLNPTSDDQTLRFFARTQAPSLNPAITDDSLLVMVSPTASTNPSEFSEVIASFRPGIGEDFAQTFVPLSVSLSAYAGSVIRVAFVRSDWAQGDNSFFLDSVSGPEVLVPPGGPSMPDPPNLAESVYTGTNLSWTNGAYSETVDLYFSTDSTAVQLLQPSARVHSGSFVELYNPPSNILSFTVCYWRVVCRNGAGQSLGPGWSFSAGNGPLGGAYGVGAGGEFADLHDAISMLESNGISESTSIRIAGGTYLESVNLQSIPGTSSTATLSFVQADSAGVVSFNYGGPDSAVLRLRNCAYVVFDGIDFGSTSAGTLQGIWIDDGCSDVTIRRARVRGASTTNTNARGVLVRGGSVHRVTLDSLEISYCYEGIRLEGIGGVNDGSTITSCRIDSVRHGIYLAQQNRCVVERNDISVNAGSTEEITGIYVATTQPGDTVLISGNRIHSLTASGATAVGVRLRSDSALAVTRVSNNFIYGFNTLGAAQIRAIYVSSGINEVVGNSVNINNVPSTGIAYGVYLATGATSGSTFLANNVLVNRKATGSAYNCFVQSASSIWDSDHNIFHGTGSGYRLGRFNQDYTTLSSWQTATGYDLHSLTGEPGYLSDQDLHVNPTNGLAHQNGEFVAWLTGDADSESRIIPPDIGADEYAFLAPASDYSVLDLPGLATTQRVASVVEVRAVILNRGSAAQVNAPIGLYFDGALAAALNATLDPLAVDTVSFAWSTPILPAAGFLTVRSNLAGDADTANDSLSVLVNVIMPPLFGTYIVGAGNTDYPNFSSAASDLSTRGVSGPVTFEVLSGDYDEQLSLSAIPNASAINTVEFRPSSSSEGPIGLRSSAGPGSVVLSGTSFVTIDRIDIRAEGTNPCAVLLNSGAANNRVSNCAVIGSSLQMTSACGVLVTGGANHGNALERLTMLGSHYGIRLEGRSNSTDSGNVIRDCMILESRTGIRADYQTNCTIIGNAISPGHEGATAGVVGIQVGLLMPGQQVSVESNRIQGGRGGVDGKGIVSYAQSGTARIVNNMISDWSMPEATALSGIVLKSGNALVCFNSLFIEGPSTSCTVTGVLDSTTGTVEVRNNIIQLESLSALSFGIQWLTGFLESDHNLFYSSQSAVDTFYAMGRTSAVVYRTLAQWISGTAMDVQSREADPGFIAPDDLHILPNESAANAAGTALVGILSDLDNDTRGDPPDIGADEYLFVAASNDFEVRWLHSLPAMVPAGASLPCSLIIANRGTQAGLSVPIRLLHEAILVEEQLLSLESDESDTVVFNWQIPAEDLASTFLSAHAELSGDEIPQNDSVTAELTIVGSALAGVYEVGGLSPDFANLSDALDHLTYRGVFAPVEIHIHAGSYWEPVVVTSIPGASPVNTVSIVAADTLSSPPRIRAPQGNSVSLLLDGAHDVILSGLRVLTPSLGNAALYLRNNSDRNVISDCILAGRDSTQTGSCVIGVDLNGNDNNRFTNLTISGAYSGIHLSDTVGVGQCAGNRIEGCSISNVRIGIYVDNQTDLVVVGNDIVPGFPTSYVAPCYGIQVTSLGAGNRVEISANRIHGFADHSASTTNRAVGVYSSPAAGATALIHNNMIYDFASVLNLKINGIYLSAGTDSVCFNSISMPDGPGQNEICGIYISNASSHMLLNNVIFGQEDDVANWGIRHATGEGLVSDYNDFYSLSPFFVIARMGAQEYPALSAWQGTGHDTNSLFSDPGFVSDTDLHVRTNNANLDGRALMISGIANDLDGDLRQATPDIGADEYVFISAPDAPQALTVHYQGTSVRLDWFPSSPALQYKVYASSIPEVTPSPEYLIAVTAQTFYDETILPADTRRYYLVTAESDPPGPLLQTQGRSR